MSNRPGLFELSMPDDDQHTLKLWKVKNSDVGQLTCIASNQFGSDSCILTLDMAGGFKALLTYSKCVWLYLHKHINLIIRVHRL